MAKFPTHVRVDLKRSKSAGLYAAVSDDLPGLMTVGNTIEEVEDRLAPAIAQLVKAQYGVDVEVTIEDQDNNDGDFQLLSRPRVMELRAA